MGFSAITLSPNIARQAAFVNRDFSWAYEPIPALGT